MMRRTPHPARKVKRMRLRRRVPTYVCIEKEERNGEGEALITPGNKLLLYC